ncbi:MAG TPA: bifunctional DNA-binding transcriptional regulator/O6-methylguanine-DNA methyltransferase Ada [Polyangiaceae bacterium]|nr:bifunctional DNA-binding transcriptional regulator/O6-methylguanine-DNA methyltransferase Ada [Polyangiaceae bacterium]
MNQLVESSPEAEAQRWQAVVERDRRASFVYAVGSTGIYCRPSCPARRPLRKNVTFHQSALLAELAGFRACKRCRPDAPAGGLEEDVSNAVVTLCRHLEETETAPSSSELAELVGWSESHTRRQFERVLGLSPRAYREALVRRRLGAELREPGTITRAAFALGLGSPSRFYERVGHMLGMTPTQFRAGAQGLCVRFAVGECSLGSILVAATDKGLCAVFLGDDPDELIGELERRFPKAELLGGEPGFDAQVATVVAWLESSVSGDFEALPLDIRGTAFQERVWRALRDIPAGETRTYAELARAIGEPTATRAVAGACAANRLAVIIPCHRVIRSDGALSGYRWGVERKRELLRREDATAACAEK